MAAIDASEATTRADARRIRADEIYARTLIAPFSVNTRCSWPSDANAARAEFGERDSVRYVRFDGLVVARQISCLTPGVDARGTADMGVQPREDERCGHARH